MARVKSRATVARKGSGRGASYPGHIRIIAGKWRSRRLPVLTSEGLRPTPDRVRETLFNWLAPYIDGARCLDLFSGTGALCLEALSRGAHEVVMVEQSREAVQQLRANVERLETKDANIINTDALDYLRGQSRAFDLVFLDPPFAVAREMIERCAERLAQGWLTPSALVYVEAPQSMTPLPVPSTWEHLRADTAGKVSYTLLRASP